MNRQALVTGGAGFIGSELVRLLLHHRYHVTVLDNFSFGRKANLTNGVRVIKGDLLSRPSLKRAVDRRYDAVYHLAAIHFIPYCNAHPEETVRVNVEGTQSLLESLRRKPPSKIFFASTAAVYNRTDRYHRETDFLDPSDIYGVTKLAGEFLMRVFHEQTGIPVVIGRLFNAYGPRETNPHLIPSLVEQLKQRKRRVELGNLHPFRDYIHTQDMARFIHRLLQRTRKGIFISNIASGEEYSVRQVVQTISSVLGEKIEVQSRRSLRRKVERLHLRGDLKRLKRSIQARPSLTFSEGIRNLLCTAGILKA